MEFILSDINIQLGDSTTESIKNGTPKLKNADCLPYKLSLYILLIEIEKNQQIEPFNIEEHAFCGAFFKYLIDHKAIGLKELKLLVVYFIGRIRPKIVEKFFVSLRQKQDVNFLPRLSFHSDLEKRNPFAMPYSIIGLFAKTVEVNFSDMNSICDRTWQQYLDDTEIGDETRFRNEYGLNVHDVNHKLQEIESRVRKIV